MGLFLLLKHKGLVLCFKMTKPNLTEKKPLIVPDNPWDPPSYWHRRERALREGKRYDDTLDSVAPEHIGVARAMDRAHPVDEWGKPILSKKRELKVDPRPTVMIPPKLILKKKPIEP